MVKSLLFWQPHHFSFNLIIFFFSHWFLWLLILALTGWFLFKKKYWQFVCFWGLLFFSEVIETVMKHFSPWSRPFYQNHVQPPDWISHYSFGSFPSGHAIRSLIVLYFLWREEKRLFWFFLPGVILVNLGRILFSLHYPIDIIGGGVIGLILVKIFNPESPILNKVKSSALNFKKNLKI